MKSGTRRYEMRARADGVAQRRQQVVDVALDLFTSRPFDEVTLQSVADGAGVSLKTVVRMFASKEGLMEACMKRGNAREDERRAVAEGDLDGVVATLGERYEQLLGKTLHMIALSERLPMIRAWIDLSRRGHMAWLARVFAPWLPPRGAERDVRLMQLFAATELYCWWSWREPLGFSRAKAARALRATLDALVQRWETQGEPS